MKQVIIIIAATFFFTAAKANVESYKAPIKIKVQKTAVKVTLQAAGKVSISWSAVANETTTTVYQIQKKTNGEFKTIAILMGESYPVYSFKDKINIISGTIEYRIVVAENNVIVGSVSQNLMVL